MKGITGRNQPNWDFFHDASPISLQSFELSRLNNAANIRREIGALLDQWVDDNSQALLARWVREQRSVPNVDPVRRCEARTDKVFDQSPIPFEPSEAPGMLPRPAVRPPRLGRAVRR